MCDSPQKKVVSARINKLCKFYKLGNRCGIKLKKASPFIWGVKIEMGKASNRYIMYCQRFSLRVILQLWFNYVNNLIPHQVLV